MTMPCYAGIALILAFIAFAWGQLERSRWVHARTVTDGVPHYTRALRLAVAAPTLATAAVCMLLAWLVI